jgi:hypothetical protein
MSQSDGKPFWKKIGSIIDPTRIDPEIEHHGEKKENLFMNFGIKSQGEGQGGCKSKCLHPEMERGRSGMSHAAPIDAEKVQ